MNLIKSSGKPNLAHVFAACQAVNCYILLRVCSVIINIEKYHYAYKHS